MIGAFQGTIAAGIPAAVVLAALLVFAIRLALAQPFDTHECVRTLTAFSVTAIVAAFLPAAIGLTDFFRNADAYVYTVLLADLILGAFSTVAHRSFSETMPDLAAFSPIRSAHERTVFLVAETHALGRVVVRLETLPALLAFAATAAAAIAAARGARAIRTGWSTAGARQVSFFYTHLIAGAVTAVPSAAVIATFLPVAIGDTAGVPVSLNPGIREAQIGEQPDIVGLVRWMCPAESGRTGAFHRFSACCKLRLNDRWLIPPYETCLGHGPSFDDTAGLGGLAFVLVEPAANPGTGVSSSGAVSGGRVSHILREALV